MNKDKKQIVVLVSLVAVVGAVGAFHFMKKGPAEEIVAQVDEKPAVEETTVSRPAIDPVISFLAGVAEERDPFVPQAIVLDDIEDDPMPVKQILPTRRRPEISTDGGPRPWEPLQDNRLPGKSIGLTDSQPLGSVTLQGIILGRVPMAIFEDDSRSQELVVEGDRLKNGALVVKITDGEVILRQNGKISTIQFRGGNS